MTIRAHFDGTVIVPDEPVQLPIGQPLEVEVEVRDPPGGADRPAHLEPRPSEDTSVRRNEAMLSALRDLEVIQRGMQPKPGRNAQAYIREARAGTMYGYEPTD